MGNVTSRVEEGGCLALRDQSRLSLASLTIVNARDKVLLHVLPNVSPASRVIARKDHGDESPVDFIQDPDALPTSTVAPFIFRLSNDEELFFHFSLNIRSGNSDPSHDIQAAQASLSGLTFAFASNLRELDLLLTREFHSDPNFHRHPNVEHLGDQRTSQEPTTKFQWTWKWRPPKPFEDKGGGWRNTCSFSEYDARAHKLQPLATFSFWVQNNPRSTIASPPVSNLSTPAVELTVPPRLRVPSSQSATSGPSESDAPDMGPPSPVFESSEALASQTSATKEPIVVGVTYPRPEEDMTAVDDGPLFRATMKAFEQKTSSLRTRMKKILRKAEAAQVAQTECNAAVSAFMEALQEASTSNAVQPAMEHYFEKIAAEILQYEKQNTVHLQKLIIDPLARIYNMDIKQADAKKKDFEEESKEYYSYVGRYLGQRQDSLKEKKRNESDSKYQDKRKRFELKRFDYSIFMQDLHGGRKEQEVLSQLTKYAETQSRSYMATAKKVGEMTPQLDALIREVREADKEFSLQRTEREEKRRTLEKTAKPFVEPEASSLTYSQSVTSNHSNKETELARSDSAARNGLHYSSSTASQTGSLLSTSGTAASSRPSSRPTSGISMSSPDKFKGIRDMEETHYAPTSVIEYKKEGLLWALSRPETHVDMKGLNKQAWHKFWIVLDQGKLAEYSNWKQRLDLHREPIDLRVASVREARNAERRFCFEVITPQFKRVYQATSEDDMHSWISALNSALQNAVEGRTSAHQPMPASYSDKSPYRDIGSILTGKSSSYAGQHHSYTPAGSSSPGFSTVQRHRTVGSRPMYSRNDSSNFEDDPDKLLSLIRDHDQGNRWCADCHNESRVEWVSINLCIILCIECSGIHRSLGTHVSKIRSLTLDTASFTIDIVEAFLLLGNRVSNMIWEATLPASDKLSPRANREERHRYITAKYVDRNFVTPMSSPQAQAHSATPEEALLTSIKRNDVQGVMYALALRANPNATDRSRNTHCVFLALAAADPAAPGGLSPSSATGATGPSPSHSPLSKTSFSHHIHHPSNSPKHDYSSGSKVHAFPVAEILVQNGAVIPSAMPAIPLTRNAQLYIDQRTGRGADTLSALPNIAKPSFPSNSGGGGGGAGGAGGPGMGSRGSVSGASALGADAFSGSSSLASSGAGAGTAYTGAAGGVHSSPAASVKSGISVSGAGFVAPGMGSPLRDHGGAHHPGAGAGTASGPGGAGGGGGSAMYGFGSNTAYTGASGMTGGSSGGGGYYGYGGGSRSSNSNAGNGNNKLQKKGSISGRLAMRSG